MKTMPLSAQLRSLSRRKGAKAVRSAGRIPANIYGRASEPQNLEVGTKDFDILVHTAHSEIILVDLNIAGDERPQRLALVQAVQHHPVSGHVLHVDFHEVKPDEMVTIRVPVESTGECAGVKAGGSLEHILLLVRVRSLPHALPEQILVDVSGLEIGKSIHLSDLVAPAGVEILGKKEVTVFKCAAALAAEPEPTAAAAAAPAEGKQPEMIKEKKGDEAPPKTDEKKGGDKKK